MSDAQNILTRAEEEGVLVGVHGGRLTHRGASPGLRLMLSYHEPAVVEALGGTYSGYEDAMREPPPPLTRHTGRHTTTQRR
jgi:hypothetical protein